ncbi:unnamed protein product [Closterium sp. NIES-64]|nr:unnamed protein product [Closterium sp. NIES-64]CAI5999729.1 unnamed protein product [Closterium sp. NIES-64]CAI6002415.1 unnamed protein product [Closterium sp. NIES-65]
MATRVSFVVVLLVVAVVGFSRPAAAAVKPYCRFSGKLVVNNLVTGLTKAGNYSTLVSALKKTGLNKDLKDLINCYEATFFAPNDDAFAALPDHAKNATSNAKVLREVLLLHVVQKKMPAAAFKALPQDKQFKAASDGCKARLVKVSAAGADPVQLQALYGPEEASVVAPDVISLRVMQVHGVDTVILPQSLKAGDKDSLKPTVCFPWRA